MASPTRDHADLDLRETERRARRGDPEVRAEQELEAAGDADPVDSSDDRNEDVGEEPFARVRHEDLELARREARDQLTQIAARAERSRTRAREHDRADLGVGPEGLDVLGQGSDHVDGERVMRALSIQGQRRNRSVALETNLTPCGRVRHTSPLLIGGHQHTAWADEVDVAS